VEERGSLSSANFFLSLRWCSTKRPRQPTLLGAFTTLSRAGPQENGPGGAGQRTRTLYRQPASTVSVRAGGSAACVLAASQFWPETRFAENTPMTSRAPFRPLTSAPEAAWKDGWQPGCCERVGRPPPRRPRPRPRTVTVAVAVGAQFISPLPFGRLRHGRAGCCHGRSSAHTSEPGTGPSFVPTGKRDTAILAFRIPPRARPRLLLVAGWFAIYCCI